jgi:hypothetical protein
MSAGCGTAACSINGDLIGASLLGKARIGEGINCGGERYRNYAIVFGGGRSGNVLPGLNVFRLKTGTVYLDLSHTLAFDSQGRACIEAHGVRVIRNVVLRIRLVIGNGDTVLNPNLLAGAEFRAARRAGEADINGGSASSGGGLCRTASDTLAILVAMAGCGGLRTNVAILALRAGIGGISACRAGRRRYNG